MCAAAGESENAGPSNERTEGGPSSEYGPETFTPQTTRQPHRMPPALPLIIRAESSRAKSLRAESLRPEPPWRLPGQPGAFTDDVAMAEPRGRPPLEIHNVVTLPPPPARPVRMSGAKGWFIGVALIAGGVGGYMGAYAPRASAPERSSSLAEPERAILATAQAPARETAWDRAPVPRMTVDAVPVLRADEPAPLTISYADAGSNVSVVIAGLAPGSTLGVGTPAAANAWRLASTDLERAAIRPPRGFVGLMNLTLELRLADDTVVDRWGLQLEWSGASAPAPAVSAVSPVPAASAGSSQRHLEASDIALLMTRGAELVENGNIGAARLMFQPAAEAGEAKAALALAQTYDPLVLEKMGAKGITPDVALAQRWYEKAKTLGATAAPESLARLTR
jgi:hypothetical protein